MMVSNFSDETGQDARREGVHQSARQGVREADFPVTGSSEEKLRFLLNYAVLAPSNRNTQPWLWRIDGDMVELYADHSRALPVDDPNDRQLILSCGATLLHLRVAIRHFGYKEQTWTFPDPEEPDLLARVQVGEEASALAEEDELFTAMSRRHTNRYAFEDRDLSASLTHELRKEAGRESAWLLFIENTGVKAELIDLIAGSDRLQGQNAPFLQETASWIRPDPSTRADGIPHRALGWGLLSHYAHDWGEAQASKDQLLTWSAPVLAVLGTDDDTPRGWLAAGQALARVLLRASASGVQASFFNSPVEVITMWPQLYHALGRAGFPQMILRLGYPTQETGPTPRRTVEEVTR
jgi:hypothetical protein